MKTLEVTSPYDGSYVGSVPFCTASEVQHAIDVAHALFFEHKIRLPKHTRIAILEKLAQLMSTQKEPLTRLCASEGGKPWMDSVVEVERAIEGVKLAIVAIQTQEGEEVAMGVNRASAGRMAFTFYEPIGVVAAISAFNHPLNLAVHQVIPAIGAGCPVIIKPASSTPLCALRLIQLLEEAGLPKGWAQGVVCDREGAQLLATSPKISFLSFIGSGTVGWDLRSRVAPGVRVALEHGGVAPVIVEADADLETLIGAIGKGGFYHAGQVCVSVQKIYAHASICNEVAHRLATYAAGLRVGNQLDPKTEVGPLISPAEVERVEAWVKEAQDLGAKVLAGGVKISSTCYAPTVLLDPAESALVSTQELFGPVVCVYSYATLEEAIARANASPFAFQGAIFTKNINKGLKAVKELHATTVLVNDHTAFRVDWMPFGGAKASGLGVGGIGHSLAEMSTKKLMIIKSDSL